ncbi:MAG: DUF2281 domain-containing protein [Proteobacteria bacterium]|nr:DUF2281 domain-containing protein [Pseudomonadota bacterium]
MTLAELAFEHFKTLPDDQAREVLDFIGYLKTKQERDSIKNLISAQEITLRHIWDNPEDDEAWNEF